MVARKGCAFCLGCGKRLKPERIGLGRCRKCFNARAVTYWKRRKAIKQVEGYVIPKNINPRDTPEFFRPMDQRPKKDLMPWIAAKE